MRLLVDLDRQVLSFLVKLHHVSLQLFEVGAADKRCADGKKQHQKKYDVNERRQVQRELLV